MVLISVPIFISGHSCTLIAIEYIFLPEDKSIRKLETQSRCIKIARCDAARAIRESKNIGNLFLWLGLAGKAGFLGGWVSPKVLICMIGREMISLNNCSLQST